MMAEGLIGNAPFLHDILILDLGSFSGFGIIHTATPDVK
jgi:hypothetical protein